MNRTPVASSPTPESVAKEGFSDNYIRILRLVAEERDLLARSREMKYHDDTIKGYVSEFDKRITYDR